MGCDIHAAIEIKNGHGWEAVTFPNKYFGKYDDEPEKTASLDFGRNYDAFAILANVRNGCGFAGVDTGDGFIPISEPRGLPDDVSECAVNTALTGDHSASFVTLPELLAYDWTRESVHRGWVNGVAFEHWDRVKEWHPVPDHYCGGISGGSVEHITEQEMRRRVAALKASAVGHEAFDAALKAKLWNTYCAIQWGETYAGAAGDLFVKVLPLMMKLGVQHGQDNVRLVMNFDS